MRPLENYTREMKEVIHEANTKKGIIGGGSMSWLMMIVGVIVTGTMTYSLTHEGMKSNALWKEWVDFAAILPVGLLEGSALALVYGRHYWFRSDTQRRIANIASWMIWGLLAATSVVHFAFGDAQDGTMKWLMSVYASYILPLAIVGVPMLWKKLYDTAPESAMRVAVLEAEASLRSQLVEVQREQNALMIEAYREGMQTPRVSAARRALFEQASIEHARNITGFIEGAEDHAQDDFPARIDASERERKPLPLLRQSRQNDGKIATVATVAYTSELKMLRECLREIALDYPMKWFRADLIEGGVLIRMFTRQKGREITIAQTRQSDKLLTCVNRPDFRSRLIDELIHQYFPIEKDKVSI